MGSSTSFRLAWTTRSVMVGIPSFRNFPVLPLGIITCRTSTGRNSPDFSKSRIWPRKAPTPTQASTMAVVALSIPAVWAPLLVDTRSHAATRNAGSQTRLNRSPKRREGSSPAQRCNLACILRTASPAEYGSGQQAAPVFTSASSDITVPPSTDTLPPFPMRTGSPRLGVLRRLRPARAFGRRRAYPRPSPRKGPWHGTHAGGSHVHCCPVDGLGTRLCPCGIATATPQTFTVASRPRQWRPCPEFPARHEERVRTANQPASTGLELAARQEA
jgi:hypothetical protein